MPVLVIYSEAQGSGLGRFLIELCSALSELGVPVHLIAPPQPHECRVSKRTKFAGPRQRRRRWTQVILTALIPLRGASAVFAATRRSDAFLMVHLAPSVPFSILPIIAARLRGAYTILNIHDIYPHTPRYLPSMRGVERFLYRLAYRLVDCLATTGPQQANRLVAEVGVRRDQVIELVHGTFDYSISASRATEMPTFLLFGSLRPNKRVRETIEAVNCLVANGLRIKLKIAGAPRREDAHYWARCKALISDPEAFEVHDHFIDEGEMANVLADVDAVLCPYEDFDSQSGVAMLALSNGLPLIATRAGAIDSPERLGAAWTEIEEPVTVRSVAAAIEYFVKLPRRVIVPASRAARDLMREEFSWKVSAERIRDLVSRSSGL